MNGGKGIVCPRRKIIFTGLFVILYLYVRQNICIKFIVLYLLCYIYALLALCIVYTLTQSTRLMTQTSHPATKP
jgi:hypothetical protein